MDDAEPKSAVEYLEDTVNFDTGEITKNTCVVEKRDDVIEGGVPGDMISFNDLVVLIVLYHGRIEEKIESRSLRHPVIMYTDFPHITNLGNVTFAPTAMVNAGSVDELLSKAAEIGDMIKRGFESQINDITSKTDDIIKRKADEIIIPSTDLRSRSSKFCDYCIDYAYKARDGVTGVFSGLYGYTFKSMLRVCRSKLFPMSGGAIGDKRSRQALDPSSSKRPAPAVDFKISPDLCVVIFDNVRRSIKQIECKRFPTVCNSICPPIESCTVAGRNADSRCRVLNVIKGFGEQEFLPFVDKYLAYSSISDELLNMGVVKLKFSIDANGNVKIEDKKIYNALALMEKICYSVLYDYKITDKNGTPQRVFWSSMKRCIDYCTRYDPGSDIELNHNNLTVLSFDLTCSSMSETISVPLELNNLVTQLRAAIPGGGGVIKKNKSSRKRIRTRKIKNRSTNVKYLRNRRNVKKVKRKTKKVRRTHRK
jgi:hypothetical protein